MRHGTRRFTTPTDSVAAVRSNVAAEMFRAITRTVLLDHTAASSSTNRVDDTVSLLVQAALAGILPPYGFARNIGQGAAPWCRNHR